MKVGFNICWLIPISMQYHQNCPSYGHPKVVGTPKNPNKCQFLNPRKTQNMGPSKKKFGVAEYLPKGYLHGKNEQNRRKKNFGGWHFTSVFNGMPLCTNPRSCDRSNLLWYANCRVVSDVIQVSVYPS